MVWLTFVGVYERELVLCGLGMGCRMIFLSKVSRWYM